MIKRLAKALIRLRLGAGWSEVLLLSHTTLLKNQACQGSSSRTVYHGGDKDDPGMRRYRPDAVPVETRLLQASSRFTTVFDSIPGYSRWVPVVSNILKQPGTWAGSTRFIPDLQGCPRCRHGCDTVQHGSSRNIKPGWTGTLNRDSENGAANCPEDIVTSYFSLGIPHRSRQPDRLLVHLSDLPCKQYEPRSDFSLRSSLIGVSCCTSVIKKWPGVYLRSI